MKTEEVINLVKQYGVAGAVDHIHQMDQGFRKNQLYPSITRLYTKYKNLKKPNNDLDKLPAFLSQEYSIRATKESKELKPRKLSLPEEEGVLRANLELAEDLRAKEKIIHQSKMKIEKLEEEKDGYRKTVRTMERRRKSLEASLSASRIKKKRVDSSVAYYRKKAEQYEKQCKEQKCQNSGMLVLSYNDFFGY